MARRGRRTVKNSATSPRSIKQRERAREALQFRTLGYTFSQIGAEMGVSATAVRNWVVTAMGEITAEPAAQLRDLQNLRLESLLTGTMDRAIAGDGEAVATCLKILDALNRLHGLIQSQRDGAEGGVGGPTCGY